MKFIPVLLMLTLCFSSCTITDKRRDKQKENANKTAVYENTIKSTIDSLMLSQIDCWNNGDIPCFMEAYWKSDSLLFVGKSGINYGWQKTLDKYLKSYASKDEMGVLQFTNEVMQLLDNKTFQVIGKWHLKRNEPLDDLQGYYSLIWQLKMGKWVIISDHSS